MYVSFFFINISSTYVMDDFEEKYNISVFLSKGKKCYTLDCAKLICYRHIYKYVKYGWVLICATVSLLYSAHVPYQVYALHTWVSRSTKHFEPMMLKYIFPKKLAFGDKDCCRQRRNLKKKKKIDNE